MVVVAGTQHVATISSIVSGQPEWMACDWGTPIMSDLMYTTNPKMPPSQAFYFDKEGEVEVANYSSCNNHRQQLQAKQPLIVLKSPCMAVLKLSWQVTIEHSSTVLGWE